jgi:hypothetical protein
MICAWFEAFATTWRNIWDETLYKERDKQSDMTEIPWHCIEETLLQYTIWWNCANISSLIEGKLSTLNAIYATFNEKHIKQITPLNSSHFKLSKGITFDVWFMMKWNNFDIVVSHSHSLSKLKLPNGTSTIKITVLPLTVHYSSSPS